MKEDAQLLPVIRVNGTEFLEDVTRREFRELRNPEHGINMHSEKGKDLLKQMISREY